jgi:SAM-dependent methyltransferase
MTFDVTAWNRSAWDRQVARGNRWTVAVGPESIAAARRGEWSIVLTPTRAVPREWFPPLAGLRVLALASGGGQQGPLLAAAGAKVVVLDLSPAQLAQDRRVTERDGLDLETVEGDMRDLRCFADGSFGLIVHPCSNAFVPDVRPVWREAFRVLRRGGVLLAGFANPALYVFDEEAAKEGRLEARHSVPYSDLVHLTEAERAKLAAEDEPLCFGHTLEDQIGGQLDAGFHLTALYEDRDPSHLVDQRMPTFLATRAVKP